MIKSINKSIILFCLFITCWSNAVADSINTFKPVEITLRTGESYEISDVTIKLLESRIKWTVSGDTELSVNLEVNNKSEKEILHLTQAKEDSPKDWGTISINLISGDNGLVKLNIMPR